MNNIRRDSNLPNELYGRTLMEYLQKNLKKSLDNYELKYGFGSGVGDHYLGIMYRVEVIDIEENKTVTSLIIKLSPENPSRRESTDTHTCFLREINFYEHIYPIYEKFQKDKGIDVENDGFHHAPHCYKTLAEEPYEGLYFEDLKANGFEMFDRLKEVTKEHVLLVMQTLAKMHAIFLCIKDQNPKEIEPYQKVSNHFVKQCEQENSPVRAWFESCKQQALEMINKKESNEVTEKIKAIYKDELYNLYKECINIDDSEPFAVLCHGDCWNNNIMFHNENGVPSDLRLQNFQRMNHASPVTDLMYYIFSNTSKALRDEHYQEFLDVYYSALSSFIQRLGSDPEKLYPHEIFNKHLKTFGKFGLYIATIVLPIFATDVNYLPDIDENSENLFKFRNEDEEIDPSVTSYTSSKTYDAYCERMMDVCVDMNNLGYI